jgi:hypothetical protein
MHRLLRRAHPWPHRDGADSGIIEGGPRRGVAGPAVVAGAARAVVLAFSLPLPLALTLAFAAVVGGGGRRGRHHQRTWWFLPRWPWGQQLLRRTPNS